MFLPRVLILKSGEGRSGNLTEVEPVVAWAVHSASLPEHWGCLWWTFMCCSQLQGSQTLSPLGQLISISFSLPLWHRKPPPSSQFSHSRTFPAPPAYSVASPGLLLGARLPCIFPALYHTVLHQPGPYELLTPVERWLNVSCRLCSCVCLPDCGGIWGFSLSLFFCLFVSPTVGYVLAYAQYMIHCSHHVLFLQICTLISGSPAFIECSYNRDRSLQNLP